MGTTSSITMQSLGKIALRAPAIGAKTWCLYVFFTDRIAVKRQPVGIKFTHRPKIRFFAPQERLVAPIQLKLDRADGHLGPLGCTKFHFNRHRGVGMRTQKCQKFPLFGKEGRLP